MLDLRDLLSIALGRAERDLSHVFERFYHGGTGLGPAISRGLVEVHGGRIWVDRVPGRG